MTENLSIPRIVIAGTHSGAGKTTVTMAILAALKRRGLKVQAFKAGPDFIDPSHHSAITGRPSRNLDTWMLPELVLLEILADGARDADVSVVEGVMGLFDGFGGTDEMGSTAHLAKMINAPVVLVIDAKGIARSAAAMIKGYLEFDKALRFAGVLFNNVGSPAHFEFLKNTVEQNLSVPILGYLSRNSQISIPERHLGLVPSQEQSPDGKMFDALADMAERSFQLDALMEAARQAPKLDITPQLFIQSGKRKSSQRPRVAVAWDKAFHFYYQDNLRLLEQAGAELVLFSPLTDKLLPANTDIVYIGGGFPEVYAQGLSENKDLHHALKDFILGGKKPVYAECGGLMYLCEAIRNFDGTLFPMVGIVPAVAAMGRQRNALGYVQADVVQDNLLSRKGDVLRGHEFHWSHLEAKPGFEKLNFAYRVRSRLGQKSKPDGIMIENLLASYTHLHFANAPATAPSAGVRRRCNGRRPALVDRMIGRLQSVSA